MCVGHLLNHTKAGYYGAAARMASLVALGLSAADFVYMPLYRGLVPTGKEKSRWKCCDRRAVRYC